MKKTISKIPGLKELYIFIKEKIIYFLEKKKWNKLKKKK